MIGRFLFLQLAAMICFSPLFAQPQSPRTSARPKAVYTPMPVYQADWARRGLAGKGVVLLTLDKDSGNVTGARMLQSTGNELLDGSALQAYSKWRFEPGTVTQIQIPIEFRPGPKAVASRRPPSHQSQMLYVLVFVALAMGVIALIRTRRS
jgi:TonB family protein